MKAVLSFVAVLFSAVLAQAGILFSDSFSYPDGAITNVAQNIWIDHSGSGDVDIVSGQARVTFADGEDVHAGIGSFTSGSGAVIYSSFTLKCVALPTTIGNYFTHLNFGTFRCLVWASISNAASGTFRLGIGNSTAVSASTGQYPTDLLTNFNYRVVTRYVVGTGQSTLWINPTNETDFSVNAGDGTPAAITVNAISLRQTTGIGTMLIDDLAVGTNFVDVVSTNGPPPTPVFITTQPQDVTVFAGDDAVFSVSVGGTAPLTYQWSSNGVPVPGQTAASFTLLSVTTNMSGSAYFVTITNISGTTNSAVAILTVNPAPVLSSNTFKFLQYNVKGNFATNWTTNGPQVQAIGRQIKYLQPDIISFNEISNPMRGEVTNWAKDFLSGYDVRVSSTTDGAIRNAIASRFPITRVTSHFADLNLEAWGYTNDNPNVEVFTRDMFEAQISVPDFPQPLHVFVVHLKSGTSDSDDATRRAAEASVVSNFFVTTFLAGTNQLHPYIFAGDLNEDLAHPATGSKQPIQRLISAPTGLLLTTPVNPVSHSNVTHSIQGNLDRRYDYIMPSALLFSNIVTSQVFRTDLLTNPPPPLLTNDDVIASDHLPVVMVFNNPYDKPFLISTFVRTNSSVTLSWNAIPGQPYRVEVSSNLLAWSPLMINLVATNYNFTFTTNNVSDSMKFFRVYRGW